MYRWNPREWRIEIGQSTPGTYPIPVLAMLLVAPVMGALFVVFLPLVGFCLLGQYCFEAAAKRTAQILARFPHAKKMV